MNQSNIEKQRVKSALSYILVGAFVLYFIEKDKSEDLQRNIYYGMIFFLSYIIFAFILKSFFVTIATFAYLWWSIVFWYKAYVWEDIKISFIDDLIKKHKK